jgi:hypothetical protein
VTLRSLILALAAGAVLATALAPAEVSAKGISGPMGVSIKTPSGPMGLKLPPSGPMGLKLPPKPGPIGFKLPPKPIPFPIGIVLHPTPGPHFGGWWWWHHHEHPWFVEHGYPVDVPVGTVSGPAPVSAPAADAPCTCLTKTYLNDGSVLFKDVCTKEAAVATPNQAQAQQ